MSLRDKGAKPYFFESDGDLDPIRSLGRIEVDIRGFFG